MFGAGFMSRKRHEARLMAAEAGVRAVHNMPRGMLEVTDGVAQDQIRKVWTGLRNLGCRADEARCAAAFTETLHGVTLEERMRAALTFLRRR